MVIGPRGAKRQIGAVTSSVLRGMQTGSFGNYRDSLYNWNKRGSTEAKRVKQAHDRDQRVRKRQLNKENMAEANKEDSSPERPRQEQQSVGQLRSINLNPEQVVVGKEEASVEEEPVFDVEGIRAHSTEEFWEIPWIIFSCLN